MIDRVKRTTLAILILAITIDLSLLHVELMRARTELRQVASRLPRPAQQEDGYGIGPPKDPFRIEWYLRAGAYVTDRPELSGIWTSEEVSRFQNRAWLYVTGGGRRVLPVEDLRIACRDTGMLVMLQTSDSGVRELARTQRRMSRPGSEVLRTLLEEGAIDSEHGGARELRTDFSFVWEYPFSRVGWWPPPQHSRAGDLTAYEGEVRWDMGEVPRGMRYYLFVDVTQNVVYIVGY